MAIENLADTGRGYSVSLDSGEVVYIDMPLAFTPDDPSLPQEDKEVLASAKIGSKVTFLGNGDRYTLRLDELAGAAWVKDVSPEDLASLEAEETSWLEPVVVKDDNPYSSLAGAEAAINTGAIQTVPVVENSRILFTAIAGQQKGVFVVVGAPPAATLQVPERPKDSQVIRVKGGTQPAAEYFFNALSGVYENTNGPQIDLDPVIELAQKGVDDADDALVAAVAADAVAVAAGVVAADSASLAESAKLEAQQAKEAAAEVKEVADAAKLVADSATQAATAAQTEVDAVEVAIGGLIDGQGNYVANTSNPLLENNASITEDLLDIAEQVLNNQIAIDAFPDAAPTLVSSTSVKGVTTVAPVDGVLVDAVVSCVWDVNVRQGSNVRGFLVHATHDGTDQADADGVPEYGTSLRVKKGSPIVGLDLDVVNVGAGPAQEMRLVITAAEAVDVYVTRTDVPA